MTIRRAVILSAGKGSRLYPYTEERPKCLLDLSGRTLLEWQLDALAACGVDDVAVVTGFGHHHVADVVAARQAVGRVELLFNPFYQVADNTGSVWIARARFGDDTLLLNGDTLVAPSLIEAVLANEVPLAVTIDRKGDYDADDMKVLRDPHGRLRRIGKAITQFNAESIGLLAFRGEGRRAFVDAVERTMMTPDGVKVWYLSVIDALAAGSVVGTTDIHGHRWQEVDYPADLDAARELTSAWASEPWSGQPG